MKFGSLKKSITLDAPKEKVWQVLTDDKLNRQWYEAFSKGTYADTDWKVGSKTIFRDQGGNGIIGKVTDNKFAELLALEYTGSVANGEEDYESEMAKGVKGATESYRLSEQDGKTRLDISIEMSQDYLDMMSKMWDTALQKIRQLAETK
jgi:uncharacterized protein YndB with AHSA1/START domain